MRPVTYSTKAPENPNPYHETSDGTNAKKAIVAPRKIASVTSLTKNACRRNDEASAEWATCASNTRDEVPIPRSPTVAKIVSIANQKPHTPYASTPSSRARMTFVIRIPIKATHFDAAAQSVSRTPLDRRSLFRIAISSQNQYRSASTERARPTGKTLDTAESRDPDRAYAEFSDEF